MSELRRPWFTLTKTGTVLPALVGGAAALAGSFAGNGWRGTDAARRAPFAAALLEDGVGLVLATAAVRRR